MNAVFSLEQGVAALKDRQNRDGGWGYFENTQSRIEPTCWAVTALTAPEEHEGATWLNAAQQCLLADQAEEGFWKASPEMKTGNWVTSLGCAVLSQHPGAENAALAGIKWLCEDYPLDSSPLLRFLRSFSSKANKPDYENAYRGWGWTPRTSSWVEPTSFALLAMHEFDRHRLPPVAERRRKLAVALLYDRMCPGGGWDCGNPRVYGVAGEPLVLPTAWALIALRQLPDHEKKSLSLTWLENQISRIQSPGSLAVASMCLECYGKDSSEAKNRLQAFGLICLLEDGIHVLAWVCLALNAKRRWPARVERRHEHS